MEAKQIYVLDTNVVINDPLCLNKFGENEIHVPMLVVEELDGLKKRVDTTGTAARQFARILEGYRVDARAEGKSLKNGVDLPSGGVLVVPVDMPHVTDFSVSLDDEKVDNLILQYTKELDIEVGDDIDVTLITKDVNLRLKADAVGVDVEDYKQSIVADDTLYEKLPTYSVEEELIAELWSVRKDDPFEMPHFHDGKDDWENGEPLVSHVNGYAILKPENNPLSEGTLIRKVLSDDGEELIHAVNKINNVYNISPRSLPQLAALDALLDPSIHIVVLVGKAGCGKSLLALAAGLQQVLGRGKSTYEKLSIMRPVISVGKELGFLPGNLREKLDPWLQPIYDNYAFLTRRDKVDPRMRGEEGFKQLEQMNKVEVQALSFIRGRSIPNTFIMLDEGQNLSPHEMKTVLTRMGEGSKIVITGDPYQIDNPYMDQHSAGITHVINRFRGESIFAHVTLEKGERSELAELAAKLL